VEHKLVKIAGRNLGKKFLYANADKEEITFCQEQIKRAIDRYSVSYAPVSRSKGNIDLSISYIIPLTIDSAWLRCSNQ